MLKKNKGFTLIELLVVIAIIGILASVVLASLNSARSKGSDAAIKANLANIRAQAALYYDTNNSYAPGTGVSCWVSGTGAANGCTSVFGTGAGAQEGLKAAAAASGFQAYAYANATGDAWVAVSMLKTSGQGYYCVDSSGSGKTVTGSYTFPIPAWMVSATPACP